MMLTDEEAIDKVNPFVTHDFSLPGSVRQIGDYDNFTEVSEESGLTEPERSVYCDYGLCADASSKCSLSRGIYPRRNIERVTIGVSNHPQFSILSGSLIIIIIALIVYYARR